MKELTTEQMLCVSGAGESESGAVDAARHVCTNNNLPADTAITITISVGGSIGMGSTNTTTGTTVEIETTCGELTKTSES